jgi:hypothetical protein
MVVVTQSVTPVTPTTVTTPIATIRAGRDASAQNSDDKPSEQGGWEDKSKGEAPRKQNSQEQNSDRQGEKANNDSSR